MPEETTTETFGFVTTCVTVDDVLVKKSELPLYTAVIEWLARVSAEVVTDAEPPDRVTTPSDVAPSKNSIEPVGVPAPGEVADTVAVNVTD